MLKKLSATLAATSLAILGFPSAANASHSWGGYHWARTSNPFTHQLGDNVDAKWDSYLGTTSTDWSKSTVLDTTIVTGSTRPRSCRATTGRVEVCNASYGGTGWLGVASISITGGTHFDTAKYNTPAWRNLVMCQEVGHTLGLDHQDENFDNANLGTCMDYTSDPSTNQHPNAHDYAQLESIYSHTDSTTTVGATATRAGKGAADIAEKESWGRLVRGSKSAHFSVYERDLGAGNKVVTFVTWA